ncbi:hypothetical protein Hanom_Chr06g00535641 [Helianthus anomalus]
MDEFMNPFSDVFAFTGGLGNGTSDNTDETTPTPSAKKILKDAMSIESSYEIRPLYLSRGAIELLPVL